MISILPGNNNNYKIVISRSIWSYLWNTPGTNLKHISRGPLWNTPGMYLKHISRGPLWNTPGTYLKHISVAISGALPKQVFDLAVT